MNNHELFTLFSRYGYLIIFFGVMLNTAGLPVPAEPFLLTSGALIGIGKMDFLTALLISITGTMTGDTFSYYIGRWGGRKFIDLYNNCSLCPAIAENRVEALYKKFGLFIIPVTKFVLGVRLLTSPLAGALRVPYLKFLILDFLGAAIWAGIYLMAGLILKNGILDVIPVIEKIRHGIVIVFMLMMAIYILFKLYRRWRSGKPDLFRLIAVMRSASRRDRRAV